MQPELPFAGVPAPPSPPQGGWRAGPEAPSPGPPAPDSPSAADIVRGTVRLFESVGLRTLTELRLASGRRVDAIGLDGRGRFAVAEVKSGLADWRADSRWPEYLPFCDRFYFAVGPGFPLDRLPAGTGIVVADRWRGEVARAAPETRMAAAARWRQTLLFAHAASARLRRLLDPAP